MLSNRVPYLYLVTNKLTMGSGMPPPILYSLRRCPYAMRARMAILLAKQTVLLRDIIIKNIPAEMLAVSAKARVPVLVFANGSVIDESLDIMIWALQQNDPDNLLYTDRPDALSAMLALIKRNDNEFVDNLQKYKVATRHHDLAKRYYRQQCERFIVNLEQRLSEHEFFIGDNLSLADYAILPFIRQFSRVERQWYLQAPYPNLRHWLNEHLQNPLFTKVMSKYPRWLDNRQNIFFGAQ